MEETLSKGGDRGTVNQRVILRILIYPNIISWKDKYLPIYLGVFESSLLEL